MIADNAVHPHHFRFQHDTPISPVVQSEGTDDSTWVAKVGFGKRWLEGEDRADDIRIWAHQECLDRPGLAGSEAVGFRALRTWASSYHPEPHGV